MTAGSGGPVNLDVERVLEQRLIDRGLRGFRMLPTAEAMIPFPQRRALDPGAEPEEQQR